MSDQQPDRRRHHALREHIDELLREGASLVGRDPVRLAIDGYSLTVRHGMLIHEQADLSETLGRIHPSDDHLQAKAIEICLAQLEQALDAAELTLEYWAFEDQV